MIEVKIGRTIHAAKPVGPEGWVDTVHGRVRMSAHVLCCDENRFAGTLRVYGPRPDVTAKNFCKKCLGLVGELVERQNLRDALRAEGKPTDVYESFNQSTWWRTREGVWLRIPEMDPEHAANAASYIHRRAGSYGFAYSLASAMRMPDDCGDMTMFVLEQDQAALERQTTDNPTAWIESTPLYKALVARTFE